MEKRGIILDSEGQACKFTGIAEGMVSFINNSRQLGIEDVDLLNRFPLHGRLIPLMTRLLLVVPVKFFHR